MCVSCGCKEYNEDHGDPRNLTIDDFQQAADAAGISVNEVAQNVQDGVRERTPVGAGTATGRGDGSTGQQGRGSETTGTVSGYTGQQPGSTGGQKPMGQEEKPFDEEERTGREF
jgi:hypothetical protein